MVTIGGVPDADHLDRFAIVVFLYEPCKYHFEIHRIPGEIGRD